MRILVIDDNVLNLISAKKTLEGHELTTCMDADEVRGLLWPPYLEDENGELKRPLQRGSLPWDVVLSDLMMPPPLRECPSIRHEFAGKKAFVGWSFVLQAALYGVKYAAVVTNLNHHEHPGATLLDPILSRQWEGDDDPPKFTVNGATVGFYADAAMVAVSDKPCVRCGGNQRNRVIRECCDSGKESGKDWGDIFKHLTQSTK